eukprot:TRINITY_DN8240_c0_g1_i2.p1 TRINITY_DN8240_c0_g1~~TRINITY_DN8240_c0_g1_i2.p1  ORF type:complete len:406 (-),score=60.87 TRINITY_DN8240_c0_g1_i2:298-1515(-)
MSSFKSWRSRECGDGKASSNKGIKTRASYFLGFVSLLMLILISMTMHEQYEHVKNEWRFKQFDSAKPSELAALSRQKYFSEQGHTQNGELGINIRRVVRALPRGIVEEITDLELKPLWSNSRTKDIEQKHQNLLAMTVGIKQKENVNFTVHKFLSENFTIILFHYDGILDDWNCFEWSRRAIHIVAQNQTKWWFAKRFLHPSIVSIYDYVFIWDEDLGVNNFHPGRFLRIMRMEGLEIAQPALDPNSTEIHHRITIRNRRGKVHRRMYYFGKNSTCTAASIGPPCTGWVEGMAPVFTRAAWECTWHLIQNDLIHGWGMDMKLGYCAHGDRSKNIGVIDSEYVFHQGIPSLGGPSANKSAISASVSRRSNGKSGSEGSVDARSEVKPYFFQAHSLVFVLYIEKHAD